MKSEHIDRDCEHPRFMGRILTAFTFALTASIWNLGVDAQDLPSRIIPSRTLPVPESVSRGLQYLIGQPPSPPQEIPKTLEAWRALVNPPPARDFSKRFAGFCEKFGVTIVPQVIGGVRCYAVTPKVVKPNYRHRIVFG